ncbi:MAG: hypothetical protein SFU85_06815 [Candidatus Methylacidiphilales bacterium]|nr:hypothetical protein [Candidatus Methylacidiphilales bacterium]
MNRDRLIAILLFLAVALVGWNFWGGWQAPMPPADQETFLGSWTDPHGPSENQIRFSTRRTNIPGGAYGIEGLIEVRGLLGVENTTGVWNYAKLRPDLQLNLVYNNQTSVVRLRQGGNDRLELTLLYTVKQGPDFKPVFIPEERPKPVWLERTAPNHGE